MLEKFNKPLLGYITRRRNIPHVKGMMRQFLLSCVGNRNPLNTLDKKSKRGIRIFKQRGNCIGESIFSLKLDCDGK